MVDKLLFIDTNILLDFYRGRSEAAIGLLEHIDAISDRVIVTFQIEMEFKKNRQAAIIEGDKDLKEATRQVRRPGLLSDSKKIKAINKATKTIEADVKHLRNRLGMALAKPTTHDPVYKVCQRLFNKADDLNLTRKTVSKKLVFRRAYKRFLLGCPPRKQSDTSMGDAINWEWMIDCAIRKKSELVIVSRDNDYGTEFNDKIYLNDHLHQEFSDRVSQKRKVILYKNLSQALKLFKIPVSEEEEAAEREMNVLVALAKNIDVNNVPEVRE